MQSWPSALILQSIAAYVKLWSQIQLKGWMLSASNNPSTFSRLLGHAGNTLVLFFDARHHRTSNNWSFILMQPLIVESWGPYIKAWRQLGVEGLFPSIWIEFLTDSAEDGCLWLLYWVEECYILCPSKVCAWRFTFHFVYPWYVALAWKYACCIFR